MLRKITKLWEWVSAAEFGVRRIRARARARRMPATRALARGPPSKRNRFPSQDKLHATRAGPNQNAFDSISGQNARGARDAALKRTRLDRRPKRRRDAPYRNARARAGVCAPRAPGGFSPATQPPQKKRVRFDVRYRYHQIEGIYCTDPAKRPRWQPKSPFGFGFAPRAARGANIDPKGKWS